MDLSYLVIRTFSTDTHVANFPSHIGQYIVPTPAPSHDLSLLRVSLLVPELSLCLT